MIMSTFYRGDSIRFNWERFSDMHLEACRMFNDTGEPISDSIKMLYLKDGTRPEAGLKLFMEVAKGPPDL